MTHQSIMFFCVNIASFCFVPNFLLVYVYIATQISATKIIGLTICGFTILTICDQAIADNAQIAIHNAATFQLMEIRLAYCLAANAVPENAGILFVPSNVAAATSG